MTITFSHARDDAANIRTFFFKTDEPVSYTAGQFVEVTLPHDKPDKRGIKRWFTLSSSPSQSLISITTKFALSKGSSYKTALQNLKPSDAVTISDPMGDFVLPKLLQTPIIFVAAGIGVTPYLSMLQWVAETNEQRPIRFLQAVSNEDEIAFQDIFDAANQHATIVVSKPSPAWGGERGHLTAEMIIGLEPLDENSLLYLSGPEKLIETLVAELKEKGVKKSQMVTDYFPGYIEI